MKRTSLMILTILAMASVAAADVSPLELEADLTAKKLHALLDGERIATWTVAVGTRQHPTPVGEFTIQRMIWNPGWVPPNTSWARGMSAKSPGDPDNPMQVVKIFFKPPDYYIHGTNKPESLGTEASHGCIRMSEEDVFELGRMIMDHGGESRSENWFQRILRGSAPNTVRLGTPVRMRIAIELE
jgi:murein L,D-transpeptidase YcbB/YkuD